MDFYDSTPEQVERIARSLSTSQQLVHALLERGHNEAEILSLTPNERFDEFCQWNGLIGWGPTLRAIMSEARRIRARDTDGSPKGSDPQGLDGEAATAGAEGIAGKGGA